MQKIYVDANVFISYWDKEYGRNIGDFLEYFSEEIFQRIISCEFYLVVSDFTIKEIKKIMTFSEKDVMFELNHYDEINKLEVINGTEKFWNKAKELSVKNNIHLADALHTVLAKESNSTLVTWNLKDFKKVKDIVNVKSPKEL